MTLCFMNLLEQTCILSYESLYLTADINNSISKRLIADGSTYYVDIQSTV